VVSAQGFEAWLTGSGYFRHRLLDGVVLPLSRA
jgi:hypothetical protein